MVNAFPPAWLPPPYTGKVFDSLEQYKKIHADTRGPIVAEITDKALKERKTKAGRQDTAQVIPTATMRL
jgi:hypothetical protein